MCFARACMYTLLMNAYKGISYWLKKTSIKNYYLCLKINLKFKLFTYDWFLSINICLLLYWSFKSNHVLKII